MRSATRPRRSVSSVRDRFAARLGRELRRASSSKSSRGGSSGSAPAWTGPGLDAPASPGRPGELPAGRPRPRRRAARRLRRRAGGETRRRSPTSRAAQPSSRRSRRRRARRPSRAPRARSPASRRAPRRRRSAGRAARSAPRASCVGRSSRGRAPGRPAPRRRPGRPARPGRTSRAKGTPSRPGRGRLRPLERREDLAGEDAPVRPRRPDGRAARAAPAERTAESGRSTARPSRRRAVRSRGPDCEAARHLFVRRVPRGDDEVRAARQGRIGGPGPPSVAGGGQAAAKRPVRQSAREPAGVEQPTARGRVPSSSAS